MPIKILLYSDFVCPFCVIAKKPLFEASAGKEVELTWMPFELAPIGYPSHSPNSDYIRNGWANSVVPLAERFEVKLDMPWHIDPLPKTHLAHEGIHFARLTGAEWRYVQAVNDAYWLDGKDISEIEVLVGVAEKIGLSGDEFAKCLENRTYQSEHKQLLQYAQVEANVHSVPTIYIGSKRVTGLHSKETYERIINEEIAYVADGLTCGEDGCATDAGDRNGGS